MSETYPSASRPRLHRPSVTFKLPDDTDDLEDEDSAQQWAPLSRGVGAEQRCVGIAISAGAAEPATAAVLPAAEPALDHSSGVWSTPKEDDALPFAGAEPALDEGRVAPADLGHTLDAAPDHSDATAEASDPALDAATIAETTSTVAADSGRTSEAAPDATSPGAAAAAVGRGVPQVPAAPVSASMWPVGGAPAEDTWLHVRISFELTHKLQAHPQTPDTRSFSKTFS